MRFRSSTVLEPAHVGRRVTVRRRLPDGKSSDVVGTLEACDETTLVVRDRHGEAWRIARADVVAARLVTSRV
jgi:ribosome maturation factor RimP